MTTAELNTLANSKPYERVAFAEVLIPGVPNVYGDLWSKENIRKFAYEYMKRGFMVDVNHDNVDVSEKVKIVEAFIVRPGDPTFIEGSWVVAVHINDSELWQQVLDGEINGYSYQALVSFLPTTLTLVDNFTRRGVTEPDTSDGHTHQFFVVVDDGNRPIAGGTDVVGGHSHTISYHTVTDQSSAHVHRWNIVKGKNGQ